MHYINKSLTNNTKIYQIIKRWFIRKVFDNEDRFVGYQAKGQDITELKVINGNKSKASQRISNDNA